jgi:hypothetical protein
MSNEEKVIKLFTDGEVTTKDERKFTRLVGGFGDSRPVISDKQISDLLGYAKGARAVRQRISENIKHFTFGMDIIDLKSSVPERDTIKETLKTLGYSRQSIDLASNIYIFSEAGFLLYLKFAEGDKAVDLYKDFLEDYFKTKAENIVMKKTIDEELVFLKEQKANILGKMFMEQDNSKKMELFNESEKITNRMTELEKTKSEKETIKKYETEITLANDLLNSNHCYDIGNFSKILDVKNLGRNNFFEWLKKQDILRGNREPYQQYMKYFKVIPLYDNRFANSKTLIRATGVKYIVNKLIKDGKVVTKSVDEILKELEPEKIA